MRALARHRPGTSLLEVIVAVTIMFAAVVAISGLVDLATGQAREIRDRSVAVQKCQSKMAEVVAGAVPLSDNSGTFDEDPEWEWSITAVPADAVNLYNVTVTVRRAGAAENAPSVTLSQIVLDPTARGSTQDTPETTATTPTDSGTGTSGTTTPTTGNTNQTGR